MSDIEELRRILIGSQLRDDLENDLNEGLSGVQKHVDQVRARLDDDEERAENVARILPAAVASADEDLSDALEKPVSVAIRRSIQKNPNELADILFPVMGPAIRASIADAMRSMMASINEMLEATLSVRGMKWRVEAWRSGVPYAEVALKNTLVYRVEQVFLINPKDSLLIGHTAAPDVIERDSDAVSAMFSALQDFVRDSFSKNENDALREIEVGGHTVWSVHGPYAMLVAVVRGSPPSALRRRLLATLESIHGKYGASLKKFNGETNSIPGLESRLDECLELEFRKDEKNADSESTQQTQDANDDSAGKTSSAFSLASLTPKILLTRALPAALALVGVVAFGVHKSRLEDRHEFALELIDQTPGFFITQSSLDGRHITLQGLQDPLAIIDYDRLSEAGIDRDSLTLSTEPYLSLESAIVERRAAQMLLLPDTITATLDQDQVLHLAGVVSETEAARMKNLAVGQTIVPGVRLIDTSSLRLSRTNGSLSSHYDGLTVKQANDAQ